MIDYSKLCQKVREALNVPIGNLEKDNQAAKKITWEDFSKRLKAEMKIENTLDECIKGSHHYEMTVKLHAGFELLLIEKKGFDEAFVYLAYNKSIRISLGKMIVSEENINRLAQFVVSCLVQCGDFLDDFSQAYVERINTERKKREYALGKFNEIIAFIESNKLNGQVCLSEPDESSACVNSKIERLNQKVFFFCGPTGSGKTSGIAKIFAPYVLNRKAQGLFKIITMDTMNVGARDVFFNWGETLHVESAACSSKEKLIEELSFSANRKFIFVDLSGYSMFELEDLLYIRDICRSVEKGKLLFVVSLATPEDLLEHMMSYHKKAGLEFNGSIVTKIDESCSNSIYKILSANKQYKPVAFIDGREIIDSAKLAKELIFDMSK